MKSGQERPWTFSPGWASPSRPRPLPGRLVSWELAGAFRGGVYVQCGDSGAETSGRTCCVKHCWWPGQALEKQEMLGIMPWRLTV